MNTMTGSIRLHDVRSTAGTLRKTAVRSPGCLRRTTTSCRKPAIDARPRATTVVLDPVFPGLDKATKLAQALTRSPFATRTEAQESREELVNTLTHGMGLALSLVAVAYLLGTVLHVGGSLRMMSCGIYGASLLLMYAASTSLHAERQPRAKLRFQLFDHVSIYLLIAGTYTPFLATLMQGFVGFGLLACVWMLAAVGIWIKLKNADRLGETSPWPCLALGWVVIVAIKPLLAVLPMGGVALLVAGGVSYSVGMLFYCRDDKRFFHAIWHLWVLAGSAFHFAAVATYVAA